VHDASPDGPFKTGMVLTIEPGIYLPQQRLGVRIEDDLLITRNGAQSLTDRIPKTVKDVEAAMNA
jgi:Xaa-Pro aminopeptidase